MRVAVRAAPSAQCQWCHLHLYPSSPTPCALPQARALDSVRLGRSSPSSCHVERALDGRRPGLESAAWAVWACCASPPAPRLLSQHRRYCILAVSAPAGSHAGSFSYGLHVIGAPYSPAASLGESENYKRGKMLAPRRARQVKSCRTSHTHCLTQVL